MNTHELLKELSRRGVRIRARGSELVVKAERSALTAELRETLAARKGEILTLLRRLDEGQELADLAFLSVDRERRHEAFPLTDIQQAYWIGRTDALALGRVGCHYYQELESRTLDPEKLERAFQRLVEHHDMLRAIVQPDGRQRILERVEPYRFEVLDLRGRTAEESAARLDALRSRLSHQVFEPERWPLFEIAVARLEGGRIRTHLSFDLMMTDATSLSRLIHDWQRFYHDPQAVEPLDISFRDYALAEFARRDTKRYRRALEYWEQRLATLPPAPELPHRPGSAVRDDIRRRRYKARLDARCWERLKSRAAEIDLTSSGILAVAFAEILGLWSPGSRFTLNVTFCRRLAIHPRIDEVLGDFTTTMLIEVDRGRQSFAARARQLHRQFSTDIDQVAVSGVEVLRRRRRHGGTIAAVPVVFTSLLGHAGSRPEVLFSSNWLGELIYGVSQTPQVSLDHQAFEDGDELVFHWDVAQNAFPAGVVEDMLATYQELLERLADDESTWTDSTLDLVPKAHLARRAAVNATGREAPELFLHGPFEDQARRHPEAPAVLGPDRTLTYGELDRRSLRLATELRQCGAKPNRLVAVVMDKGWEQVVAVMGILRSGAAYLPIAADLPAARVRHLLERGEVEVAVTQGRVDASLDWPEEVTRIVIAEEPDDSMPAALAPVQTVNDLAYTIFTSGSTGEPKGVMISHRAVVNTILDVNERFAVGPSDRVLALSSLGFDLSVYDIFGVLAAGGTIVLPTAAASRDPEHWAQRVARHRVTIWNSVPALMKMVVEHLPASSCQLEALRLVMLSGDWIPLDLPEQIRRLNSGTEVISLGGATEASIWSILYPVGEVDPAWQSIPYGKPMVNQSFHVLDEDLRPCPDWVPGELYIGGAGLAMGYWRDPEETAYRFVEDPATGARLYRTGDLGRYLDDGNIEILGRVDFQVKIRGNRIELGEIESVLVQLESVRAAVVAAPPDARGEKRLVAYVVAAGGGEEEWRASLAAQLPGYMVPETFVVLDVLPLSANDKVDRSRLPAPASEPREPSVPPAPADGIEELVCNLVRDVLECGNVGVGDRFAALGANSVQMVQIHRRLPPELRGKLAVAQIFDHPDVRSLATFLSRDEKTANTDRSVELAARRRRRTRRRQMSVRG